ncbi:unnamed protein product [Microthlaspi erraticum]|uniref:RNase H type-1 domain-containing protein n=1 Tax=Microthlaspi erraticum TaxID=1685480 RepID=A0A6D2J8M2_9BRAS|nr:unnamed protein product [Microthlaspi erraticum]
MEANSSPPARDEIFTYPMDKPDLTLDMRKIPKTTPASVHAADSMIKYRDKVKIVKDKETEVTLAQEKEGLKRTVNTERVERLIRGTYPDQGWVKLNTDDTSRGNPVIAASGGVIRNASRLWCRSFALNIGTCTSPLAELWGVYYGLLIAWESKAHRVEVEVDSEMVVGFLKTGINEVHLLSFVMYLCHGFISRGWKFVFFHVYRETNHLWTD